MSNFHQPRRGWLPQLLDGLKLVLLAAFLIGYVVVSVPSHKIQVPKDGMELKQVNPGYTKLTEDSIQ
ncbi:MAG: hypothetical protein MRZ79_09460 [Bacteroidia bacterium]|nr:hypothetical protein [Bacteroidia bacterium]